MTLPKLSASLSEAISKHVHTGGEFFGEIDQILFHVLLVCPLPKVDFHPYWLHACWENTGIYKHDVIITYARQETHRFINDDLLVPKMSRVLSILVGNSTICSHPMSLEVSKKSW